MEQNDNEPVALLLLMVVSLITIGIAAAFLPAFLT